jgi:hypothetical protein
MKTEKGVKSVVVGGRPQAGPMQGVGATRGGQVMELETLVATFETIYNQTKDPSVLPLIPVPGNGAIYPIDLHVNLADQIRKDDKSQTPLQFIYEASDCRIWFTPEMLLDYTHLWQRAAEALWSNSTYCVKNSTGQLSSGNVTVTGPPNSTLSGTASFSAPPYSNDATIQRGLGWLALGALGLIALL